MILILLNNKDFSFMFQLCVIQFRLVLEARPQVFVWAMKLDFELEFVLQACFPSVLSLSRCTTSNGH